VDDLRSEVDIEAERVKVLSEPGGETPFVDQTPIVDSASLKSVPSKITRTLKRRKVGLLAAILIVAASALVSILVGKKTEVKPLPGAAVDAGVEALADAGMAAGPTVDAGPALVEPADTAPSEPDGGSKPVVAQSQPRTLPTLTRPAVERILYKHAGRLQACADRFLAQDNLGESVSLKLKFTINSGGRIIEAALEPASLENTAFGRCLLERVRAVGFPSHRDPSVTVVFPLTFRTVQ
jgi:hypothetical protein